ncbi:GspH/FimT family pseudopilin [Pseudoalteromonas sp. YIC-656]|uniref:GspH/FimT family pseudopilin n=1 Tax=Pseudoalteromonas pernae TaxID=3118054 RepID=UPI003242814B
MKTCQQSNNKGFTLLELMLTLAIASILIGIALFNTTELTTREKANNFAAEFKRHTKFARSKAITTGDPVIMCAMSNPGATGACQNSWQTGTIVIFSDVNNNQSFDSSEDILLRSVSNLVTGSKLVHNGGATNIRFNQQGLVTAGQDGLFIFCPKGDNSFNVAVEILDSGTVRSRGKTNLACG